MTPRDAQPPEVDAPPTTLTDFLLARLAEDEAVAIATRDSYDPLGWDGYTEAPAVGLDGPVDGPSGYTSLIIDPARVLAEVAAKRRIVELHNGGTVDGQPVTHECDGSLGVVECATLRALASVYADHPDFREDWRA